MDVEFFLGGRASESLTCECFYPDDAVLFWESRLTGVAVKDLMSQGEPRVIAPMANDGYQEFALSDRLCVALAAASQDRLHGIAAEWADLEAQDGDPDSITAETAAEILEGVAALARKRRRIHCRWG